MIARMDRLEIVCLRDDLRPLTLALQEAGLLHVEEVPLALENVPDFLHRVHLDDDQRDQAERVEELARLLRETEPLLTVKPRYDEVAQAARSLPELYGDEFLDRAREWTEELRAKVRQRANLRDNLEILENYRRMLENIRPVLGERNVTLGHGARAVVLQGDVARAVPALEERLKARLSQVELITQPVGRKTVAGLILYSQDEDDLAGRILADEGITPVDVPDNSLRGLEVSEVIARIDRTVASQRQELERIEEELNRTSRERGPALAAMQRIVADKLAQLQVVDSFAQSNLVAVIQGWSPADRSADLERLLDERFPGRVSVTRLPMEGIERRQVPTLLQNHKWLRPFETTLMIFKPPTYGTFDPSPLVGIFFVLFFGFIVGDLGYGLSIMGLVWLLRRKFRHYPVVVQATTIGFYASASAMFFGILYGEFFGSFGERFGMPVLWIHRGHIEEAVQILLIAAVAIGVIHIYLSLLVAVWENYRLGHKHHAEEKLGSTLGLTALIVAVFSLAGFLPRGLGLGLALILFIGCLVLLIRAAKAFAAVHVLEIFSLVSNILSYARLMALGIAAVVLADLANRVGEALGLVGILLAILIHFFNIVLSMFSPTIHSLRLNYVEFLSKFYAPEGRAYKPFRKEAIW